MRLFIAIEFADAKDYFKELQKALPSDVAKIKLVHTFHLTLKFLGDVFEEKVDKLKEKLASVHFKPLKLKLKEVGVFPAESYVKVIWVGLQENKALEKLQKDIEKVLEEFHFRKDFSFVPHLTLARVKFISDREKFMKVLKEINVEPKEVEIKKFKLIKSTLTKEGSIYEDLGVFQ